MDKGLRNKDQGVEVMEVMLKNKNSLSGGFFPENTDSSSQDIDYHHENISIGCQIKDKRKEVKEEMFENDEFNFGNTALNNTESYSQGIDNSYESMDILSVQIKQEPEGQEEHNLVLQNSYYPTDKNNSIFENTNLKVEKVYWENRHINTGNPEFKIENCGSIYRSDHVNSDLESNVMLDRQQETIFYKGSQVSENTDSLRNKDQKVEIMEEMLENKNSLSGGFLLDNTDASSQGIDYPHGNMGNGCQIKDKRKEVNAEMFENENFNFGNIALNNTESYSQGIDNPYESIDILSVQIKQEPEGQEEHSLVLQNSFYPNDKNNSSFENTNLKVEKSYWENRHINTGNPEFKIENCGSFYRPGHVNSDLESNVTLDRQQETIFCQITQNISWFSSADHVNEHISSDVQTHGKESNNPKQMKMHEDICGADYVCDKEVKSNSELQSPQISHQNDPPHVCDVCKSTFKTSTHLNKHMGLHSSEILSSTSYNCEICGLQFKQIKALSEHNMTAHTDESHFPGRPMLTELKFKCPECNKGFKYQSVFKKHMLTHSDDCPFICSVCDRGFKQKSCLNQHMLIHSDDHPFTCGVCDQVFKRRKYLKRHLLTHSDDRHMCSVCDKGFTLRSYLIQHMLTHSDDRQYMCSVCDKGFKHQSNLNNHKLIHSDGLPSCSVCGKVLKALSSLKFHMLTHSNERPITCSVCDKGFKCQIYLKRHMLVHSDDCQCTCSVCDKGFKTQKYLKVHMLTHSNEHPFICKVCDKRVKNQSNLKKHMLTHSDHRPFTCSMCDKGFFQKSHLKHHMLTHSDKPPFTCSLCDKGFMYETHLKSHMLTHSDDRQYMCSVCDKGFKDRSHLNHHMLSHSDDRQFMCSVCGKRFKERSHLNQHMSTHSDDRQFLCSVCDKGFKRPSHLKHHILTHSLKCTL